MNKQLSFRKAPTFEKLALLVLNLLSSCHSSAFLPNTATMETDGMMRKRLQHVEQIHELLDLSHINCCAAISMTD